MRLLMSAVLLAATLVAAGGTGPAARAAAVPDNQTLWYEQPATDWETQSLPIGNGALGATVFGGVATEQLQVNEKTLWTGGPGSPGYDFGNWRSPRPGAIGDVKAQIDRDTRMTPEAVAARLGQGKTGFGSYQTFGDVWLDTGHGGATGYRRELSLSEAIARVRYTSGGVDYTREYFASFPGNVIVGRLTASQPGRVSFTLRTTSPRNDRQVSVSNGRLRIRGALADNGMRFEGQIQVLTSGGSRSDGGDRVTVSGADSAMFVMSMGTDYADTYPSYRGADPQARVTAAVDQAAARGFDALRQAHLADYRALNDRVRLDLGQGTPQVPTDRLRSAYTGGSSSDDRALEALFFAYGRYLLVSSSRSGSLPANLQGVWNNSTSPPWSADYHVNINLQMNYWPAEQTALPETVAPLTRYVQQLAAPGRRTAQEMFGSRGWVVHNETNPFGFTGVHNWATSFWFPEAAAWLCRHLYERYRFSGDRALLQSVYPAMREAALFWVDNLHTDPRDGRKVVSPSYSPEHGDFSAGAAMSQQIVADLFGNVLAAAAVLGTDEPEVRQALAALDRGLRVGSWGQLQEWKADWDSRTDDHRHVSHLYALHPGDAIQPGTAFAQAAKVSLTARGDGGTGWSKAWKINFWARLLDGDHAHKMLSEQLRTSTLANLWDTHPPFQIDGNFGATSGVAEMLLQSQHGVIHPAPAVPAAWPAGSVTGLRARGNVAVDVAWRGRAAERVTLRPGGPGTLRVRTPLSVLKDDTGAAVPYTRDGDTLTFTAQAGRTYTLTGSPGPCATAPADRPVVAWDPVSGTTVTDSSGNGRTATIVGSGGYSAGALLLNGSTYLTTAPTTLGLLPEATFAAQVRIAGSGYRRLFDSQPSGNPGDDGIIVDVTPSGHLRFIGAGRNITTDAALPTGRLIELVVTLGRTGVITVYVDGARAGGGQTGAGGIMGCATRPLRFAADQDGRQRLSGAVDRMAVLARALPAADVPRWKEIAFP
ncbi:glycosyl hydrolase family 95 catalytic domain-containing protein [Nonomuraea soli]|uniref:Alpha-L-fucosidase 2 n=1 Tax=Nonomuraea soli TaxID=1032476 RepID=A0A7W0CNS2_9ACTN|nr:glycoside hydrolase N-terminal domain-containing protein [Nonomuraea soli]MBA2894468.1 alpha-L-fucosidase 2 [Nonomuraea soli]